MSVAAVAPRGLTENSGVRRTALALLATALGVTPLKALLSDSTWLFEAWLTMAVVIVPAMLIRLRSAPGALDIWPGIVLLVPWLTRIFVPQHAWGSIIPTRATFGDVSHLMDSLHRTTRDEVAPIHSTPAVRLVICALLGLTAALIDLVAVVGRRGALAGVPLLVVYTVAGAVPRSPVAWGWFALAAVAFLLLLSLDAADELHDWGRRITRRGSPGARPVRGISARRIGLAAIVAAVVLPMLLPAHGKNLLADAFRGGGGNGVGGFGAGGGGGGSISPFVALKGQLDRTKPVDLFKVHVETSSRSEPFYLRTNVVDHYTADVGWSVSGHGPSEPIGETDFGTNPPAEADRHAHFQATITVKALSGNAPVFANPDTVDGLADGTSWSPQDQVLLGPPVHKGQQFVEQIGQPEPSVTSLRSSAEVDGLEFRRWLVAPQLPKYVTDLVTRLTRGKNGPYERARAISDYFADPANGFVYSLKTKPGDSGSALVDFLKNGSGYCQQYAAAMAVMLRAAGVPSRVVLGYMHSPADQHGDFTVTTLDAHSWVEAYFAGIGWVPFDPTPAAGLSGGRTGDLAWAPHQFPSNSNDGRPTASSSSGRPQTGPTSSGPTNAAVPVAVHSGSSSTPLWVLLGVVLVALLAAIPALARAGRRRRRYAAARHGDPDPLWAELSDTAIDLGYVWSPARSPRQVSAWLARDAGSTAPALDALAAAVEHRRYAPGSTLTDTRDLVRGLHDVTGQLRSRRSRRMRVRAACWPASLGWGGRWGLRRMIARHRR